MIQVYTGDGKGKTTAALGLAIRALGAGKSVYIMQFMKSRAYSEHKILTALSKKPVVETTGKPFFIAEEGSLTEEERKTFGDDVVIFPKGNPPADYAALAADGLLRAAAVGQNFDVVILDEINVALFFGLLENKATQEKLNELRQNKAREIICTGRNAPDWLIEMADLVTEMKEVKHYYRQGIMARVGIEN